MTKPDIKIPPPFKEFVFDVPLEFNGKTYTSITLRPPTFAEKGQSMRHGRVDDEARGLEQVLFLIHLISSPSNDGVGKFPVEALKNLPDYYLDEFQEYIVSFITARKKNAKTSSST